MASEFYGIHSQRHGNTRPLYLPPEKPECRTIIVRHGTMDWFQIGKGLCQGCILASCFLDLYAEYIMWNARLDETQAGIKTAKRNINNFRYADDTTLMAESEEELKSLLMKVKEENEKAGIGNTCTSVADSCWCMAKPIQYCKVINLQLKWIN